MTASTLLFAILTCWPLTLLAIWVLFFWLYRDYRIDALRLQLFTLRDQLFDYAAAGNIPLDHPSYRALRAELNGMIRFAHRLNFTWLIVAMLVQAFRPTPEVDQRVRREVAHMLSNAPAAARDTIKRAHDTAMVLAIEHVLLGSPVFWILLLPIVFVLVVRVVWLRGARLLKYFPGVNLVEREAVALGAAA